MDLRELLTSGRDAILRRWMERVRGTLHPTSMPRLELVDHLPLFLDEVQHALRFNESPEKSPTAAEHGVQRLSLGFNLDAVVREYGALRDSIVAEAGVEGVVIQPGEREILFDCVITGIAEAVSEYQRQRDTEMQRQTSEHFAFIAHELRNPLGTARSALKMLDALKPANERLSGIAERSLSRMQDLIDRSLRLARIGSGITLNRETIKLRSLLDEAKMAATADADAKDVDVTIHLETDEEINVDVRLVHSALVNLVCNAVKFTHQSGRVQIRGQKGVRGGDGSGMIRIEVEDRCGGLPPGTLERAFAPFVQMGVDRSGFGLGLAIAKQAADAHGGTIQIQDLPGKGCIFALELPSL